MKKTLSLVLALALAVSMIASMALIVPSTTTSADPFVLSGVKVTDAAGYAAPYAAVDSAAAFVENQAAYVVVSYVLKGRNGTDFDALVSGKVYTTDVTSASLDLSYADDTAKAVTVKTDGSITTVNALTGSTVPFAVSYSSTDVKAVVTFTTSATEVALQDATTDKEAKFFVSFIAVTKPATAGDVKAALKVASTKFATNSSIPTTTTLNVYDSTGLKYIIDRDTTAAGLGDIFTVSTWNGIGTAQANKKELFSFVNTLGNAKFDAIFKSTGNTSYQTRVDYYGKIWDVKGTPADTTDDVDITDVVNAVNSFFGFSFANTDYPVLPKHFTDKTVGNPIVVSDTYAYVTAAVTDGDGDVDIAPTGDFSANIVIVMAASAVLAAAALAFVAKKARD